MTDHQLTEAVELLKSRDAKKRMTAVDMAAELNTAGSVALLIKAIQDQSWSLREYAIKKIALAGHQAVQPLIRLLRDGVWYTRAAALQALELIGDIAALSAVMELCKDPNRSVSEAANKAALGLSRNAEKEILYSATENMTADRCNTLVELIAKSDANLSKDLQAHLAHVQLDEATTSRPGPGDEPGAAERLQGLRREIKTILRQSDRDGNEDA